MQNSSHLLTHQQSQLAQAPNDIEPGGGSGRLAPADLFAHDGCPAQTKLGRGIRQRAMVKPQLPAAFLASSLTTDHLPKLPPAAISGSDEVSGDRPRDAQ